MIYVTLEGRIGNQLFMYAIARDMQKRAGNDCRIVIDDRPVLKLKWENSLKRYDLPGVEYVSDGAKTDGAHLTMAKIIKFFYLHLSAHLLTPRKRHEFELKHRDFFQRHGLVYCVDGYVPLPEKIDRDYLTKGFFQSPKYLESNKEELMNLYRIEDEVKASNYPNLDKIMERNTVCISIKVEHNAGSLMYDVCTREYWEKAIEYITEHVENPLFFICSDNVEYVLEHYIDSSRYDVVFQSREFPVNISLAVMAQCKHFIIGNTSFGWWAQYLSDYKNKIVVTPSRWYGLDIPCDLYQDNWTTIEV